MQESSSPINMKEWCALHQSYEQAERVSIVIKLTAVIVSAAMATIGVGVFLICALLAVLWLQEAIWKTFQSRTEQRLIKLEGCSTNIGVAFYSDWQQHRPTNVGLIKGYLAQAFRPTIAYPYSFLIVFHWCLDVAG